MKRFLAIYDTHYGFERRNGKLQELHDPKAIAAMLAFASDFKPHHLILGGDILDCGAISHHNHGKPGATEGMKLILDAERCQRELLDPLSAAMAPSPSAVYITGNHEAWLQDHAMAVPGLEGLLDIPRLLKLPKHMTHLPQGKTHKFGKILFCHGDTIKGGEFPAKAGVLFYQANIRFGHHHTYQAFTMTSAVDDKQPKTGIAVPCLCHKDPAYNKSKPNRWAQGFLYGYVEDNGNFHDAVAVIVNGKTVVSGKVFKG